MEVGDVDLASLAGTASTAEIDQLRAAFDERHLVLIRGPVLSGEAQAGFVARFSRLVPERRLWGYVSNVREDGIVPEGALLFHAGHDLGVKVTWRPDVAHEPFKGLVEHRITGVFGGALLVH